MVARRKHEGARGPRAGASSGAQVYLGGPHAVRAAIAGDSPLARFGGALVVERVCVEEAPNQRGRNKRTAEIVALAKRGDIPVARLGKGECDRLAGVRCQGIAAEIRYTYADIDAVLQHGRAADSSRPSESAGLAAHLLVYIDGIEDPHNLGAIVRTADAAGALAVVVPARRNARITAAVVRTSAGAALKLPICRVTNLVQAMRRAQACGYWLIGLDQDGGGLLDAAPAGRPLGLVVGAEGSGLGRLVHETCDEIARLPMRGGADSLNASVAASLAIYRVCERELYDKNPC